MLDSNDETRGRALPCLPAEPRRAPPAALTRKPVAARRPRDVLAQKTLIFSAGERRVPLDKWRQAILVIMTSETLPESKRESPFEKNQIAKRIMDPETIKWFNRVSRPEKGPLGKFKTAVRKNGGSTVSEMIAPLQMRVRYVPPCLLPELSLMRARGADA